MQLEGSHRQVEGSLGSSWLELAPGTGTLSSDSNSFLLPLSWILTRECSLMLLWQICKRFRTNFLFLFLFNYKTNSC